MYGDTSQLKNLHNKLKKAYKTRQNNLKKNCRPKWRWILVFFALHRHVAVASSQRQTEVQSQHYLKIQPQTHIVVGMPRYSISIIGAG